MSADSTQEDGYRDFATRTAPKEITPWPERLLKAPLGDPFFFGSVSKDTPLVLDFGSHRVRAGFATQQDPFLDLPTIFSRYRVDKYGAEDSSELFVRTFVGNDILLLPPAAKKITPFDFNVPFHMDGVEYIMDHVIQRMLTKNRPGASDEDLIDLGSDTDDEFESDTKQPKLREGGIIGRSTSHQKAASYDAGVDHPLLITEPPLVPRSVRSKFMQLAFEAYGSSSLCFGVDALFSLLYDHHHNYVGCTATTGFESTSQSNDQMFETKIGPNGLESRENGLSIGGDLSYPDYAMVISSGFESTHVLPVIHGESQNSKFVRISIGGHHATTAMNNSVQLLYAQHKTAWSKYLPSASILAPGYAAAEAVKEQECVVASPDYLSTLRQIQQNTMDPSFYHTFQFSYEPKKIVTMSDEERKLREVTQQANAERMRETNRRRLVEKLLEKVQRLEVLEKLFDARQNLDEKEFHKVLTEAEIDEADWPNAAGGGPHDKVIQEISEVKKYLERKVDDGLAADRLTPGWGGKPLEEKLSMQATRYPYTIIEDNDLAEGEAGLKKVQTYLRRVAETKIQKSHPRELSRYKEEVIIVSKTPSSSTTSQAASGSNAPVEVYLDISKDLNMIGLDELQSQRKAVWTRLQRRLGSLDERKSELKVARDAANEATVIDVALIAANKEAASTTTSSNMKSGPGAARNGVGSIAGSIGSRSGRASKSNLALLGATANMDLEELEHYAATKMENPDMLSVQAKERVSSIEHSISKLNTSISTDRELLAKLQDEILGRLDPDILRQREAESYQMTLGVPRIRCPEIMFQPSMIGSEQMGLIEAIQSSLMRCSLPASSVDSNLRSTRTFSAGSSGLTSQLLRNIYLTGGNSSFPMMSSRVHAALAAEQPIGSFIRVVQSSSPSLNAWRGAALFASRASNLQQHFVPQAAYYEEGPERLNERFLTHFAANRS